MTSLNDAVKLYKIKMHECKTESHQPIKARTNDDNHFLKAYCHTQKQDILINSSKPVLLCFDKSSKYVTKSILCILRQ